MKNLYCPCILGLERVLANELLALGYAEEQVFLSDAGVTLCFKQEEAAIQAVARLNFALRTAERVYLELASFPAQTFDDLFENTSMLPWEDWLNPGAEIVVGGYSRKSVLYGVPSMQRLIKKAIIEHLKKHLGYRDRVPEDPQAGRMNLQFAMVDNHLSLRLDTSGVGLHKRGYRPLKHEAPIKETLAAGILLLGRWPDFSAQGEGLWDPFAGSGTFAIEGAMLLAGIAPGLKRHFSFEKHRLGGQALFDRARERAKLEARRRGDLPEQPIFASDIDARAVQLIQENAKRAGVADLIVTKREAIQNWTRSSAKAFTGHSQLLLVANPPYGERLGDAEGAAKILRSLGRLAFERDGQLSDGLRLSLITQDDQAERELRARADKRRKLYNGDLACTLYQFFRKRNRESR